MNADRLGSMETGPAERVEQRRDLANVRARAAQCRRLVASVGDQRTATTLRAMAEEYEEEARQMEQSLRSH
jgi:hypothetical protein